MAMAYDGVQVASATAHHLLSAVHQSVHASLVSFYAHLFAICQGGYYQARTH
jgi:hypothetical protein